MKTSEQITDIAKALSTTQKEMRAASKDSNNPFFKSKYSDLSSVIDVIREPMGVYGLSFVQDVTLDDKGANISTRLLHSSGQWIEFGPLTIPLKQKDAHGVGSAITYGKRYALCAALGVVSSEDQDDDANTHVDPPKNYISKEQKKINKEQWTELNKLIDQCDQDFQQKITERSASLGIQSMAELDEETFVKMRDACRGHIAKNNKVKSEINIP